MGWSSANPIFNRTANAIISTGIPDEAVTAICVALIRVLQDGDWDTEDESLDKYTNYPAIVEAFRQCGVYALCGHTSPDRRNWCKLENGHAEVFHDDFNGTTWPKTEVSDA